jgi:hypothetical protein
MTYHFNYVGILIPFSGDGILGLSISLESLNMRSFENMTNGVHHAGDVVEILNVTFIKIKIKNWYKN